MTRCIASQVANLTVEEVLVCMSVGCTRTPEILAVVMGDFFSEEGARGREGSHGGVETEGR